MNKSGKGVIGVLLLLVLVVALSGCTNSNSQTNNGSNQQSSSSSQSNQPFEQTSAVQDVVIEISYSGAWSGSILSNNNEQKISGSGYQTYNLGKPTGFVRVSVSKESQSTDSITAKIKQGSNVLDSQTTDSSYAYASHTF